MDSLQKEVELLTLFKNNMIEFLDELIEQFEEEGDLIIMRFFISEQIPLEDLMKRFNKYVMPHQEIIRNKNEKFFLENDNIFGSSPQEKVVHFKKLYLKMSEDDKNTLWSWFNVFIHICDKYNNLYK